VRRHNLFQGIFLLLLVFGLIFLIFRNLLHSKTTESNIFLESNPYGIAILFSPQKIAGNFFIICN